MAEKLKLLDWNVLDYLDSEEAITSYLQAAIEENNPESLIHAIGDIARARGINQMAKDMGVDRESLYKSDMVSDTVLSILKAKLMTGNTRKIDSDFKGV